MSRGLPVKLQETQCQECGRVGLWEITMTRRFKAGDVLYHAKCGALRRRGLFGTVLEHCGNSVSWAEKP